MARGVPGHNHILFFLPKCPSESVYVYIKVVNKGGYDTSGVYKITSSRELPVQTFFSSVVVPCCVFLPPLWLSLSPGLSTTTAKYTHSTNIYNPLRSIQKKKKEFSLNLNRMKIMDFNLKLLLLSTSRNTIRSPTFNIGSSLMSDRLPFSVLHHQDVSVLTHDGSSGSVGTFCVLHPVTVTPLV